MTDARRSAARGFTLIEVLLAAAISAVVMLTVATTFHAMLNARDVVDDLAESTEAGPRIMNLIERDLLGIWTFNVHDNAVFRGRNLDISGKEADRIDFLCTTDAVGTVLDGNNVPRKPTLCEVGYWLKPNPRFRDLLELWRREDPMVDDDLVTQGTFQLVHDRIKHFKVTYYRTLGKSSEELLEWDSKLEDSLPKRIKISFSIERRRSSRNVVSDLEVADLEGALRTYERHIVFDARLDGILAADSARMPVFPIEPTEEAGGPSGPAGSGGPAGPAGPGGFGGPAGSGGASTTRTIGGKLPGGDGGGGRDAGGAAAGRGAGGPTRGGGTRGPGIGSTVGGQVPTQLPPGFNPADIFRGISGGSGGGGAGGIFGGR